MDRLRELLTARDREFRQQGNRVLHRGGPLTPELLLTLFVYQASAGNDRGYRRMLDGFWARAADHGVELPCKDPVSAQAFSAARRKIPAEFVREILVAAAHEFDADFAERLRWRGRRLLAVDGARRFTRRSAELERVFGSKAGGHYPQMLICTLYDVVAEVPIDAVVGSGASSSERAHLMTLCRSVRPSDVVVLDRGFPSFDVFANILAAEADFVVRMRKARGFKAAADFAASGKSEAVVTLTRRSGAQAPDAVREITVRLIRVERRGGEPWILATSLPADEFPAECIADAYTRRWRIEEFYGQLVADYCDQAFFHSKSADGVRQEVFAQLLFVVITRATMAAVAKTSGIEYSHLSRKGATLATADGLIRLLRTGDPERYPDFLRRLLRRVARALERPRPGRSAPRRSLLPAAKWTPLGRRGRR